MTRKLSLIGVVLLSSTLFALSASAVTCTHGADISKQGTSVLGLSTVVCSGGVITYHEVRVQEKYLGVWLTRGVTSSNPNTAQDQELTSASCAGHGTDYWRTRGYYEDSGGGSGTKYAPGSGGVSYTC